MQTDSGDYYILTNGVESIRDVPGLTCEIGLRAGGGSEYIMRALHDTGQYTRTHIAIDPYGNIEYETSEGQRTRHDYTNDMRDDCMVEIFKLAKELRINFVFFNLEDTEFFKAFPHGVPIYRKYRHDENQYAFVHFDGPHAYAPLAVEFDFFNARAPKGAVFVFDDVANYDHDKFETNILFLNQWALIEKTGIKASYRKTG
jgi:hypothetical protein